MKTDQFETYKRAMVSSFIVSGIKMSEVAELGEDSFYSETKIYGNWEDESN